MTQDSAIRVGAIHIIESLRPGDLPTGERLRDDLVPLTRPYGAQMTVHFWREPTRIALLDRLTTIADDVRLNGRAPVVHIETHGGPQGLQLTSGEVVRWSDLKGPLTAINVVSRLNLLVLLGACDGAGLLEIIQATDRAPVWALIGPRRPVTDLEIDEAHRAFYRTLFSARDVALAWQSMNATSAADAPFRCFRAEDMFREIVRAYLRDHCSSERMAARIRRLVDAARAAGLPPREDELAASLRNHRSFFEMTKQHFFIMDLCPDHPTRFRMSLEEFNVDAAAV